VYDAIGKGAVGEFAQVENIFDIDLVADIGLDYGFVGCQNLSGAASDGAEAEKCNVQHNKETSKSDLQMCVEAHISLSYHNFRQNANKISKRLEKNKKT
jgi:hypothetical protein